MAHSFCFAAATADKRTAEALVEAYFGFEEVFGRDLTHEPRFREAVTRALSFDPELDVVLHTDLESQEQSYDVTYQVSGPLSDWTTTTSAVAGSASA